MNNLPMINAVADGKVPDFTIAPLFMYIVSSREVERQIKATMKKKKCYIDGFVCPTLWR